MRAQLRLELYLGTHRHARTPRSMIPLADKEKGVFLGGCGGGGVGSGGRGREDTIRTPHSD
jgi:hypothetical protein